MACSTGRSMQEFLTDFKTPLLPQQWRGQAKERCRNSARLDSGNLIAGDVRRRPFGGPSGAPSKAPQGLIDETDGKVMHQGARPSLILAQAFRRHS